MNKLKKTKFSFKSFLSGKKGSGTDPVSSRVNGIKTDELNSSDLIVEKSAKTTQQTGNKNILNKGMTSQIKKKTNGFKAQKFIAAPLSVMNKAFDKFDLAFLKLLDKLGLSGKMGKITRSNAAWRIIPLALIIVVGTFLAVNLTSKTHAGYSRLLANGSMLPFFCTDEKYKAEYATLCNPSEHKLAKRALPGPLDVFFNKVWEPGLSDAKVKKSIKSGYVKILESHHEWIRKGPKLMLGTEAKKTQAAYGVKIGPGGKYDGEVEDTSDEVEEGKSDAKGVSLHIPKGSEGYNNNSVESCKTVDVVYDVPGNKKETTQSNRMTWFSSNTVTWNRTSSSYGFRGSTNPSTCEVGTANQNYNAGKVTLHLVKHLEESENYETIYGGLALSGGSYSSMVIENEVQNPNEPKRIEKIINYGSSPLTIKSNIIVDELVNIGGGIVTVEGATINVLESDSGTVILNGQSKVRAMEVNGGTVKFNDSSRLSYDGNGRSSYINGGVVTFSGDTVSAAAITVKNGAELKIKGNSKIGIFDQLSGAVRSTLTVEQGGKLYVVGQPEIQDDLDIKSGATVWGMGGCFWDEDIRTKNTDANVNWGYSYKYIFPGFDAYNDTSKPSVPICIKLNVKLSAPDQYIGRNNTSLMRDIKVIGETIDGTETIVNNFTLPADVKKMFKVTYTSAEAAKLHIGSGESTTTALFGGPLVSMTAFDSAGEVNVGAQVKMCESETSCDIVATSDRENGHYDIKVHIMNINFYEYGIKDPNTDGTTLVYNRHTALSDKEGVAIVKGILENGTVNGKEVSFANTIKTAVNGNRRINFFIEQEPTNSPDLDQDVLDDTFRNGKYHATSWNMRIGVYVNDDVDNTAYYADGLKPAERVGYIDRYAFSEKDLGNITTAMYVPSALAALIKTNRSDSNGQLTLTVVYDDTEGKTVTQVVTNGESGGFKNWTVLSPSGNGKRVYVLHTSQKKKLGSYSLFFDGNNCIGDIFTNSMDGNGSTSEPDYHSTADCMPPAAVRSVLIKIKAAFAGTVSFKSGIPDRNEREEYPLLLLPGEQYKGSYVIYGGSYAGSGNDFRLDGNGNPGQLPSGVNLNELVPVSSQDTSSIDVIKIDFTGTVPQRTKINNDTKLDLEVMVGGGKFYVAYDCGDKGIPNENAAGLIEDPYGVDKYVQEFDFDPTKEDNSKELLRDVCSRVDYNLVGWATVQNDDGTYTAVLRNGQAISFPEPIKGEFYKNGGKMSLTAVWEPIKENLPTLNFTGDLGIRNVTIQSASGATTDWNGSYEKGEVLTVTVTTKSNQGYEFAGFDSGIADKWKGYFREVSKNPAEGTWIYKITMPEYSLSFKAVTDRSLSYTIQYNCNGGNGVVGDQTALYGVTIALHNPSACWRNGYRFSGWSTEQKDTRDQLTNAGKFFADGQTGQDFGNITLYAVWSPDSTTQTSTESTTRRLRVIAGGGVEAVWIDNGEEGLDKSADITAATATIHYRLGGEYIFSNWGSSDASIIPNADGVVTLPSTNQITTIYVYSTRPTKLFTINYDDNSSWFAVADDEDDEPSEGGSEGEEYEDLCYISPQRIGYYQINYLRNTSCNELNSDDPDSTLVYTHNAHWSRTATDPSTARIMDDVTISGGERFMIPSGVDGHSERFSLSNEETTNGSMTLYAVWAKEDSANKKAVYPSIDNGSRECVTGYGTKSGYTYFTSGTNVEMVYTAVPGCEVGIVAWGQDSKTNLTIGTANNFTMPDEAVETVAAKTSVLGKFNVCTYPNTGIADYDSQYQSGTCHEHYIYRIGGDDPDQLTGTIYYKKIGDKYYQNLYWVKDEDKAKTNVDEVTLYADTSELSAVVNKDTIKKNDTVSLYAWWGCPEYCIEIYPDQVILKKDTDINKAWFNVDGTYYPYSPNEEYASENFLKFGIGHRPVATGTTVPFGARWEAHITNAEWDLSFANNTSANTTLGTPTLLANTTIFNQDNSFKKTSEPDIMSVRSIGSKGYTVKYDCNGGVGVIDSITVPYNYSQNIDLPAERCTREGFTQTGWAKTSNATVKDYDESSQVEVRSLFPDPLTTETTLYAFWTKTTADCEGDNCPTKCPDGQVCTAPLIDPECEGDVGRCDMHLTIYGDSNTLTSLSVAIQGTDKSRTLSPIPDDNKAVGIPVYVMADKTLNISGAVKENSKYMTINTASTSDTLISRITNTGQNKYNLTTIKGQNLRATFTGARIDLDPSCSDTDSCDEFAAATSRGSDGSPSGVLNEEIYLSTTDPKDQEPTLKVSPQGVFLISEEKKVYFGGRPDSSHPFVGLGDHSEGLTVSGEKNDFNTTMPKQSGSKKQYIVKLAGAEPIHDECKATPIPSDCHKIIFKPLNNAGISSIYAKPNKDNDTGRINKTGGELIYGLAKSGLPVYFGGTSDTKNLYDYVFVSNKTDNITEDFTGKQNNFEMNMPSSDGEVWLDAHSTDSSSKYKIDVKTGTGINGYSITSEPAGEKIDDVMKYSGGSTITLEFTLDSGYDYVSETSLQSKQVKVEKDGDSGTKFKFTMPNEDVTIGDVLGVIAGVNHCTNKEKDCYEVKVNSKTGVSTVSIGNDKEGQSVSAKYNAGTKVVTHYNLSNGYSLDKYDVTPSNLTLSSEEGNAYSFTMPAQNVEISFYGKNGGGTQECVGNICVTCDETGKCKVCVGDYCVECENYDQCKKCLTGTCEICDNEGNCIVCNNYICVVCDKDKQCVVCVNGVCIKCTSEDQCKKCLTGTCDITDPVNPKKKIVCKDFVCMVCDDNGQCKVCVGGMCVKCTETECLKCVLEGECQICDDEGNCIYCSGGSCTICDRYGNCKNCKNGICTICTKDNCPNAPGTGYSTDPNEADKFSNSIPLVISVILLASGLYLVYYYKYKKKGIRIAQIRDKYWTGQR